MAHESGWWTLNTNIEPNDCDLEHIAELIKQGYTSGEICGSEQDDEDYSRFNQWPCNICTAQKPECDTDKQHFPCLVENDEITSI